MAESVQSALASLINQKLPLLDVTVRYEWLSDPGAPGGGSWLQEKGTIHAVTDTAIRFSNEKTSKIHDVIPLSALKGILYAAPPGK